jgi:protease-4
MDIKALLSIINRPWFIEPTQAQHYVDFAAQMLRTGSVPGGDKRGFYSDAKGLDFGPIFRVDEVGNLTKDGPVQVIRINYPIAKYDFCGDPGTQTLQQLIAAGNADKSVQSFVLWLDSPGGQVDGTEALANTIESSPKPIIGYSDHMMYSAAYWLGCSTRELIVHGANNGWNAGVGSIGTMCMWEDRSGKYEQEGIKIHTVFATESTDKWGDHFERNNGNYTRLIQELDGINSTFIAAVKKNRGGKLNLAQENVLTGKTYNAKEAMKYGLIDKIGDFQYAVKRSLQFSRQKSTQTQENMAKFPKTFAAAKADKDFEVCNEGIWLTEDNLTSLESAITQQETELSTRANRITSLEGELETATSNLQTQIQAANDAQARITTLEQEIVTLKAKDSQQATKPDSDADDKFPDGKEPNRFETSADRELRQMIGEHQ